MKNRIFLLPFLLLPLQELYAQEAPVEETSQQNSLENPSLRGIVDSIQMDEVVVEKNLNIEEEKESELPPPLKLYFPEYPAWNIINEGQKIDFTVNATGGVDSLFSYSIPQGKVKGMEFDTAGHFSWTPGYEFVQRLHSDTTIQVIFEARNQNDESIREVVDFTVLHVNRPPVVGDLKPFYVASNTSNTYTIESSAVKDEDNDPIVFVPILGSMPEGAKLSAQGEFTWKPSYTQFNQLSSQPIQLEFYVEDQPSKARTKGSFVIKQTQKDMPPSILITPSQTHFEYKEDVTINLKFHLHDPNGENNLSSFNFIADNPNIPASALVKNTPTQYEFIWKPGYDFVRDPLDSLPFNITFFVLDKSNKKDERTLHFSILNAINEAEIDHKLYNEYRASLVRAWDLMEQLKEAEKDLKKKYRKAKRGKKARSLTNASLGAATGITPVVVEEPGTSKKITTIGGTAVMTIGTLEATEVFGRSSKDLVERLNYIMEKRNELQTKGDIFARKYALKSSRRKAEFMKDVDDFVAVMNLKGLVALELDAAWQNKNKATDQNIAKTYKDFSGEN